MATQSDTGVKHSELVWSSDVGQLIERGGVPERVERKTDAVAGEYHVAGEDDVAVQERTVNELTDAVEVNGDSGDEGSSSISPSVVAAFLSLRRACGWFSIAQCAV